MADEITTTGDQTTTTDYDTTAIPPVTNYQVNGVDLFSGVAGPGQPVGASGYNVGGIGRNLFSH